MDEKQHPAPAAVTKEIQVPEWEHTAAHGPLADTSRKASLLSRIRIKYETAMSSMASSSVGGSRRWYGMTRRTMIWLIVALFLIVAAIVIGVAVGLTRKQAHDNAPHNLPLPGNTDTFSGQLTYYAPGLGACGIYSGDNDYIAAVSHIIFDAAGSSSASGGNSNNNPLCNRKLRATRYDSAVGQQRSVDLTVVDRCVGCAATDLDTSEGVFGQMAAIDQGRVDVTWAWL